MSMPNAQAGEAGAPGSTIMGAFCEHSLEVCKKCKCDHRLINNVTFGLDILDPRAVRDAIRQIHPAKQVTGSGLVCLDHDKEGCHICFNCAKWVKRQLIGQPRARYGCADDVPYKTVYGFTVKT